MKRWVKVLITVIVILVIIIGGGLFYFVKKMSSFQVDLQYGGVKDTVKRSLDFTPFEEAINSLSEDKYNQLDEFLKEATIEEIQVKLKEKSFTCEELVTYYLTNIKKHDENKLNSVIELNPDALQIARDIDTNPNSHQGKLQGIPVLLKDNIGTGDKMHTTAGADVLKDNQSTDDAPVVKNLREEGAIILGKANLSEWAYYLSPGAPSGFTAVGGQTFNPYGKFDVGGSSSGSAVSVSANLATISVGTETCGSIISPSSQNSVVGMRPSLGFVDKNNIIPISSALDTAGPVSKNVKDSALLMDVLAKNNTEGHKFDNTKVNVIKKGDAEKLTIGVVNSSSFSKKDKEILEKIKKDLKTIGFNVKEIKLSKDYDKQIDISKILKESMEKDVNSYFINHSKNPELTLKRVTEINAENPDARIPFGQDYLTGSVENPEMTTTEFDNLVEQATSAARSVLDPQLKDCNAIVSLNNQTSLYYAVAGYPAVTVPAGYKSNEEPAGATFVGKAFSEEDLLSIAMTFENATKYRKSPILK